MEKESFLTGYCRCLDSARSVIAVTENGELLEVDCSYEGCPFTADCTVAARIKELMEN